MEDGEGGNKGFLKGMALLASLGFSMVIATFIGLAMGFYLDRYLETSPIFTLIFMVLGIAAGFRNIYLLVKRYGS
ncbi:MAG: AtpZ/AtpI family protein [Thermodesulfobacteriota bacterium]